MIFIDCKENFKRSKFLSIVIILLISIGLCFLNISINNINKNKITITDLSNKTEKNYKIVDNFFNKQETEFKNTPDNITRLKNFNDLLNNNKTFKYMEINFQNLYINELDIDEVFLSGYDIGKSNKPIDISGALYNNVKCAQINQTAVAKNSISIIEGALFNEDDYVLKKVEKIPAILGYQYLNHYDIGDVILVDYLGIQTSIEVIGFMKNNSNLIYNDQIISLNRYIVLPSLQIDETTSSTIPREFFYRLYLNKNSGIIIAHNYNTNEIQSMVSSLSKQANLYNYIVIGASNYKLDLINIYAEDFILINFVITALVLIFATINLIVSFINKINENLRVYAIYILNGYTTKYIKLVLALEGVIYIVTANFLAVILTYIILDKVTYNINLLFANIIIIMIFIYSIHTMIKKVKLNQIIREI